MTQGKLAKVALFLVLGYALLAFSLGFWCGSRNAEARHAEARRLAADKCREVAKKQINAMPDRDFKDIQFCSAEELGFIWVDMPAKVTK